MKGNRLEKAGAILAALAVWQLAAMLLDNSLFLVTPFVVARKLMTLVFTVDFWSAIAFTFLRIEIGFFLALFLGTILAFAAGRFRVIGVMLQPYMAVVKATPVASFIILCLIWLNARNLAVFIAFLMGLPIIYTNVLQGFHAADIKLLEMARLFDVGWRRKFRYIYIPQVKPYLLSACSMAVGLTWKAGVAAEVIGIPDGSIGEKLYNAKVYLNTGELFAWSVVIVVISILFEKIFMHAARALFSYRRKR
ncbi:ABC transporter permease [Parasporobacterium paucivorans]|uniref:ABC transporter permease n=1 Tax=Parasporobacterium paucivorans TaxID=115544 RepID=UPI000AA7DE24|nr:ABC transporter permease subunit [Parasporobacterium paucivorans]